jgi:high affinity sulfate transporter 1
VTAAATSRPSSASLSRYLPILGWLPRYPIAALPQDLVAALTVWALVVPQAIAYSEIAGLPPEHGLFAAAGGLLGYGLLGTCRQLMVSPTSSTAAISASLVAVLAAGDVARMASLSAALAILAGLALGLLGFLKLGFVSRFIPTAVQVGFMFGLGLTIIAGQLDKLLGTSAGEGTFFEELRNLAASLGDADAWTIAVGAIALGALVIVPRVTPRIPIALVVVIGGILAVSLLGLADKGVAVIGLVDGAVPFPAIPDIQPGDLAALVPGAVAIAIVGSAEGLTVAQGFAQRHRYEIDPDQELRASGGSNIVSGLFQGFIVGGGASQSAAADNAGATSALVSLMVAALTAATSVFLLPLFQDLPQAVLGAIVISAVVGFLRVGELRRLLAIRRGPFLMAILALVVTLVLGILPGLITAVLVSMLLVLVVFARPTVRVGTDPLHLGVVGEPGPESVVVGPLIIRLDAPLLYVNAGALQEGIRQALQERATRPDLLVIDLSLSPDLDIESADTVDRIAEQLEGEGIELRLGGVHRAVRIILERAAANGARTLAAFATMAEALGQDSGGVT